MTGRDEVAFAMDVDGGEVLDLFFVFGVRLPPLQGIGRDAVDRVVEDLGSVDGLIEVAAQTGVRGWGGGVFGMTCDGERWW